MRSEQVQIRNCRGQRIDFQSRWRGKDTTGATYQRELIVLLALLGSEDYFLAIGVRSQPCV